MKRNWLSVFLILLFFAVMAAPAQAWQGRMAGVGDAYGLIEDESDYLTHPAVIAMGKGFNAYGHYRLTYNKTAKWDYSRNVPDDYISFKADGYEWKNEGLLGTVFQVGAGRMGVFFEYVGVNGKYKGDENEIYEGDDYYYYTFKMKYRLDNYALRLIYGLPVGAVNLGAEIQLAYRNEKKETSMLDFDWNEGNVIKNYPWGVNDNPWYNLFPYMIPYRSKYWEAQGKLSAAGMLGAAKYAFTLKGGLPFASDNKYTGGDDEDGIMNWEGKVKGFNIGGDFWLRVPLSNAVALPFVVSAGYSQIKRDGDYWWDATSVDTYGHEVKNLFVEVGGGVDFTPAKGTRLAAGLYYAYLHAKENAYFDWDDLDDDTYSPEYHYTYSDYPKNTQHRLTLKMLAEKELTPVFVLRGGVSAFYSWVKSDYTSAAIEYSWPYYPMAISLSGYNVDVNASMGATVKLNKVILEPFLNAGYVKYKVKGDGTYDDDLLQMKLDKVNWLVGGGLSVKF